MRSRAILFALAAALAAAAPAAAAGPVWVVVGAQPAPSSRALTHAERERTRLHRALARAERLANSAPLLSDRLDAQRAVFQLQSANGRESDTIANLEQQVATLEADPSAPAPVVPAAPAYQPFPFSGATSLGIHAVTLALHYVGVPYVWGGADPVTGFDCSGLAQYVYGQLGITLSHYTRSQIHEGVPVPLDQLRPGDLVFFEPGVAGPSHEGIYIGSGEVVEAPHTGADVRVSSLAAMQARDGYVGAVRPYVTPSVLSGF